VSVDLVAIETVNPGDEVLLRHVGQMVVSSVERWPDGLYTLTYFQHDEVTHENRARARRGSMTTARLIEKEMKAMPERTLLHIVRGRRTTADRMRDPDGERTSRAAQPEAARAIARTGRRVLPDAAARADRRRAPRAGTRGERDDLGRHRWVRTTGPTDVDAIAETLASADDKTWVMLGADERRALPRAGARDRGADRQGSRASRARAGDRARMKTTVAGLTIETGPVVFVTDIWASRPIYHRRAEPFDVARDRTACGVGLYAFADGYARTALPPKHAVRIGRPCVKCWPELQRQGALFEGQRRHAPRPRATQEELA
jgi:hypothetical protein